MNNTIQSVRTYDFDVLKKTLPKQDVSGVTKYQVPEKLMPDVMNQKDCQCCMACAIAGILSAMSQAKTDSMEQYSISYIYGKHRTADSTNPGMLAESALRSMLNCGSIPFEMFPQLVEMPEVKQMVAEHPQWDKFAEASKLRGYCQIRWNNSAVKFENIKLALVNYQMPLLAISKHGFGESHCILLYGFEMRNGEPYVMLQNSWGKTYGTNGRVSVALSKIDHVYILFDEKIELSFEDVAPEDWFYKAVRNMYLQGYVNGKSATEFCPNEHMTRAEVCTLIDRILKRQDEIHQAEFEMLEQRLERLEGKA